MRQEHCEFKQLNKAGRCIAPCHYNIQSDEDCTGKEGKTLEIDYVPAPGSKEVKL